MFCKKAILPYCALLLLPVCKINAQGGNGFAYSNPEAEGISSAGIIQFLDAAAKSNTEFHSFVLVRHNKIAAEGWWNPYAKELTHTMYSASKSFTATAVGFAISEGRLHLDDKVISFFPQQVPATVPPYLAELTVKDVLTMSDGMDPDPTALVVVSDSDWVKGFMGVTIKNEPGTKFLYNSLGTYMLSAMVQKVTGQKVIDYLRPRLFEPLGIKGIDWEVDAKGINTGGWGLRIKTEDMAKFGELFLDGGKWHGKQILPVGWVEQATTKKIDQDPTAPQSKKDSSDWLQGYCYQMWRCRHNGFRADGAFGQYIIMLPDEDALIAITAESPNMQDEINLVWQYLLPAMHGGSLPADDNNYNTLKQRLAALSLPPLTKMASSSIQSSISGKSYSLMSNSKQLKSISFAFKGDDCELTLTDAASYKLLFGSGEWEGGTTTMHGPYLLTGAKATLTGLPPFKIDGSYQWQDDKTLQLKLRYIQSPHTETIVCHFDGSNLSMDMINSFDYGTKKTTITGQQQ